MTFSEKSQCSGCSACKYACSTGSIMMQRDEEGFLYPSIDPDTCVNCGKCVNACPIKSPHLDSAKPFTQLACQNVNDNCRMNSTSGGMFSAIAELVLSRGGTVFAAEYGVSCRVVHSAAHKIEDLENMRMSKYVQSDMQETIAQLHSEVERDVPIFFIGTPCQTEGVLQSFAGEIPDNLFTADLVCYGVPSPGLYDRWIESIKSKYNADVVEIRFRDKKYGYAGTNIKIVLNNGKLIEDCKEAKSFVKTMFSHIGLRPS